MFASMQGRYEEAERLVLQYVPTALRTQHPAWLAVMRMQFYDIRRGQSRLGELEQIFLENAEQAAGGPVPYLQAAIAYLYLETERPEQAREWFERLAANDFADVPRDASFLATLRLCVGLVRRPPDPRRAALLYEMLRPYAGRQIVSGTALLCTGSASRPLGQLATTMGNWEDAQRHFEDALAFDEKIGARPWLARTQYEYADMLRERGQPDDHENAQGLANQALAVFEELGMPKDVERALALKMELQGISSTDVVTSIDAVAAAVESEQPTFPPNTVAPDGTVTLLFTDIEGSTPLNERLGDQRWMALLREHNALVREQLQAHEAYEVKTEGDGFMVAFGSARKAVQCAIAIQRAFDKRNTDADEPMLVRIGLHTGEPVKENNDFYGTQVTQAARIGNEANGGEILVSALLKELTGAGGDISFSEERQVELKGLGEQRVFQVDWNN